MSKCKSYRKVIFEEHQRMAITNIIAVAVKEKQGD